VQRHDYVARMLSVAHKPPVRSPGGPRPPCPSRRRSLRMPTTTVRTGWLVQAVRSAQSLAGHESRRDATWRLDAPSRRTPWTSRCSWSSGMYLLPSARFVRQAPTCRTPRVPWTPTGPSARARSRRRRADPCRRPRVPTRSCGRRSRGHRRADGDRRGGRATTRPLLVAPRTRTDTAAPIGGAATGVRTRLGATTVAARLAGGVEVRR